MFFLDSVLANYPTIQPPRVQASNQLYTKLSTNVRQSNYKRTSECIWVLSYVLGFESSVLITK